MMTAYMFQKIRVLIAEKKSDRFIAREVGCDRKTVSKYRDSNAPPEYSSRKMRTRQDPLMDFDADVRRLLAGTPTLTGHEIFLLLKEFGYTGGFRTVQRRLGKIRSEAAKERFFEQKYEPGEQSQFDFKESVALLFNDGIKIVNLHFGTLPHSGFFDISGYPFKTYEAFMTGVHTFFEAAGGMSEKIRFDNLSPCVKKVLTGDKRIYTDAFQRATEYYGFGLLPCAPGKGSDKGDVEREIRSQILHITNTISVTGKVFKDFEDLNRWLSELCAKFRTSKINERWKNEQAFLLPLPPRKQSILSRVEISLATSFGTVHALKSTYSVPDEVIGKTLRVVIGAYDVKIYHAGDETSLIVAHPRCVDGEKSILMEHVLPSLIRKPHAMVRWAHKELLFPKPIFKTYYARLQKLFGYAAEREYLRTINLVQYVPLTEIAAGIELVLESESLSPFEDVKHLVLDLGSMPSRAGDHALSQEPLSPVLSIYDNLIPSLTPLQEVINL